MELVPVWAVDLRPAALGNALLVCAGVLVEAAVHKHRHLVAAFDPASKRRQDMG
jgi:hypothetical protein